MDLPRKQSHHESGPIRSEDDTRIACYRWSNYSFRDCRSKALAWFVQFAIRSDLAQVVGCLRRGSNFNAVMNGYPEIQKKISEILALIRERHILDEGDLRSIDLSLFHFPTLAEFFDAARCHAFVREASIEELRIALEYVYKTVAASAVEELFSDEDGDFSLPVLHAVWDTRPPVRFNARPELPKTRSPASGSLWSISRRR